MNQLIQVGIVAGITASVVSFVFVFVGQFVSQWRERRHSAAAAWREIGEPVVHAADDLIGRLFDVMVRERRLDMSSPLRLEGFAIYDPPSELSTVWRLARYLAASISLEKDIAEYGHVPEISTLRFYAANKLRMALKGNLYDPDFKLQTEGQQIVGGKVLALAPEEDIDHLTFYHFFEGIRRDEEVREVGDACRRFLDCDLDLDSLPGDLLTISMACIYLIDLVQDLRPTSKWEEFRVFLVSILKARNTLSARTPVFLYSRGDLSSSNYFDTFNVLPSDRRRGWRFLVPEAARTKKRRRHRIESRQSKAFGRTIDETGVVRQSRAGMIALRYDATSEELLDELRRLFG